MHHVSSGHQLEKAYGISMKELDKIYKEGKSAHKRHKVLNFPSSSHTNKPTLREGGGNTNHQSLHEKINKKKYPSPRRSLQPNYGVAKELIEDHPFELHQQLSIYNNAS
jgi:hypothetical protein